MLLDTRGEGIPNGAEFPGISNRAEKSTDELKIESDPNFNPFDNLEGEEARQKATELNELLKPKGINMRPDEVNRFNKINDLLGKSPEDIAFDTEIEAAIQGASSAKLYGIKKDPSLQNEEAIGQAGIDLDKAA
jgi:hypothetical protein